MAVKIFLDYDEAQLDQQYNIEVRDRWSYHEAEYLRASDEAVNNFTNATLNIHYGDGANERLDVYPATSPNAPVHVFIHGGYWREGDMALWRFIASGIVGNDVTLVLPTYSISPETHVQTIVEQMHKALEWTCNNIADYGGNAQNISVSGHSAGGHLATMLMTTDWSARGYNHDVIKAVVAISGLFDMEPISVCRYLRDDYSLSFSADDIAKLSPNRLKPVVNCPLHLVVGENESEEYQRNTDLLASVWSDKGFAVTKTAYSGHQHFSIILELANPKSHLTKMICQLASQC
jgi:arylformamidase